MTILSEQIDLEDDIEQIYAYYYERGWTDGLPIIPPTAARVERTLSILGDIDPGYVVAKIPPRLGQATYEKIAINAVMAGCLPEYLPIVVAAVKAVCEDQFNLYGIQTTTNAVTPFLLINGPIREKLSINCRYNAFGQGWRANATIGRALRMLLVNVGGAVPGLLDKATVGQPGKYSFCCGENEEENPWEPFHVTAGFDRNRSTVTAVGVTGITNILDWSGSGEEVLTTICRTINGVGGNDYLSGGQPLIALCPEHARILANDGFDKDKVQKFIFEHSKVQLKDFPHKTQVMIKNRRSHEFSEPLTEESLIPISPKPEDILIAVIGGPSVHSAVLLTIGVTRAVTKVIDQGGE